MTPIEFLKAELSAIDRLNCVYWQTEDADRYEKLAYLVRQRRRQELITELLRLMQRGATDSSHYPPIQPVLILSNCRHCSIQYTLY
jgi:hypothetical protein